MKINAINQVDIKREAWIDNVKMFAIILVVVSHCFHYFTTTPYECFPIRPFVNAFNMYLFALISGITSFKSINNIKTFRDLFNYIEKMSVRIAVPCVGFMLLSGITTLLFEGLYSKVLLLLMVFVFYCMFVRFFLIPKESEHTNNHKSDKINIFLYNLLITNKLNGGGIFEKYAN